MSSLGWGCLGVWGVINGLIAYRLLRRTSRSGERKGIAISAVSSDDELRQGTTTAR
jgi:hypothetical protein